MEPSFQVMSDVIDKILEPMQQEGQKQVPANSNQNSGRRLVLSRSSPLTAFSSAQFSLIGLTWCRVML